jgi:phage terminase Nu1 subunit (DNA packaging protein)
MSLVSLTEFARLFEFSQPRASYLVAQGMPAGTLQVGKLREINVRAAHDWLVERALSAARTPDGGESKEQAELRKSRADADAAEIRVAESRGELVRFDLIEQLIDRVMTLCATQLDGLGGRMAGRLAAESDPAVIRWVLLEECRIIRSAMAAEFEAASIVSPGGEGDSSSADEDSGPVGGSVPNPAARKRRTRAVAQQ